MVTLLVLINLSSSGVSVETRDFCQARPQQVEVQLVPLVIASKAWTLMKVNRPEQLTDLNA